MFQTTKCEYCGKETPILVTPWAQKFPNLCDLYEGECIHCGERIKRKLYKCLDCNRYTLHRSIRMEKRESKDKYGSITEQPFQIFQCDICGREKSIYQGMRASYERSMMSTGR